MRKQHVRVIVAQQQYRDRSQFRSSYILVPGSYKQFVVCASSQLIDVSANDCCNLVFTTSFFAAPKTDCPAIFHLMKIVDGDTMTLNKNFINLFYRQKPAYDAHVDLQHASHLKTTGNARRQRGPDVNDRSRSYAHIFSS